MQNERGKCMNGAEKCKKRGSSETGELTVKQGCSGMRESGSAQDEGI
jgi:hypothetical protein